MTVAPLQETRVAIAPVPESYLRRVQSEGIDDLGQPVQRMVAAGGEPCRDVLRRARPGERLILSGFTPFSRRGPYREYGPIFVRAYSALEEILDAELVEVPEFAATVERFFRRPETAFLHVRFPTYGCFACRIDRS